jgi:hypothetical protein
VTAVALSSNGRHALSGSGDHTLRWWDVQQGRCISMFTWDYAIASLSMCSQVSSDRIRFVAGDDQGNVLFFELIAPITT